MVGNTFTLEDLQDTLAQPQTSAALRARVTWARQFDPAKAEAWRLRRAMKTPGGISRGPEKRLDQQWAAFQVGYATQGVGAFLPYEMVSEDEMQTVAQDTGLRVPEWERGVRVPKASSPTVTLADLAQDVPVPEKKSGIIAALPYLALAVGAIWLVSSLIGSSKTSFE